MLKSQSRYQAEQGCHPRESDPGGCARSHGSCTCDLEVFSGTSNCHSYSRNGRPEREGALLSHLIPLRDPEYVWKIYHESLANKKFHYSQSLVSSPQFAMFEFCSTEEVGAADAKNEHQAESGLVELPTYKGCRGMFSGWKVTL